MHEYTDLRAYDTIQRVVENSFNKLINKQIKDIKTIVIIGAFHGIEIYKFLDNYPYCTIYAFEAYYKNYTQLENNFKSNPRVKLFNLAISDNKGMEIFYELCDIGNGSLLKTITPSKIIDTVAIKTDILSNIISDPIDLLWVDVQGAELKVLKGADLTKIESMFLEIAVKEKHKGQYEKQCYLHELEAFLINTHTLHSIGLDNEYNNGTGNSFWVRK